MSCVEIRRDVGGCLFNYKGEEGEIREGRIDGQVIY